MHLLADYTAKNEMENLCRKFQFWFLLVEYLVAVAQLFINYRLADSAA
jgi:hypothetical protein